MRQKLEDAIEKYFHVLIEGGGGPHRLDSLSIEISSERLVVRARPQAASANG